MTFIVNAAILATFIGALTFVTMYAWLTRGEWKHSAMGRHVQTFMAVITIVTFLAVLSIFFGTNWPGRIYIRGLTWSAIAFCMWWRVALLYKAQKPRRGRSIHDEVPQVHEGK